MKRIIMRLHILLLICSSSIQIEAQEQFEGTQLIPPSPNAASLGQYADVPVSNYTGLANLSIPVYTIKSGEIELPITLSYHSSGIKVAQEASWVGLGWALNAGGMISRQVRGKDDFGQEGLSGNGFITHPDIPNPATAQYPFDKENLFYYRNTNSGDHDTEPDLFYYNFMGHSGKFVFEKRSTGSVSPISILQNNLKFVRRGNQWEVTDGNGWKFYLGTREITRNFGKERGGAIYPEYVYGPTNTSIEGITTAWYLDKIVTPTGDEISFIYANGSRTSCTQVSFSESFYKRIDFEYKIQGQPDGTQTTINNIAPRRIDSFSASMQQTAEVYLESIVFKNGRVNFIKGKREDIRPPRSQSYRLPKLEKIEILDLDDQVIKRVDLGYSYFNGQPSGGISASSNRLRLRLDKVTESFWDATNKILVSKPSYQLGYDPRSLPWKTSFSVDHWGYYNGALNHNIPHPGYRTPIRKLTPQVLNTDGEVVFAGANRESSFEHMGVGMLKSIQYPTGATAHLNFEPNHSRNTNGVTVDKTLAFVTDYPLGSASSVEKERTFLLEEPSRVKLSFSLINHSYGLNGEEYIPNTSVFDQMIAELTPAAGGVPIKFRPDQNIESYQDTKFIDLPAGLHKLKVLTPSDKHFEIQFRASHRATVEGTYINTLPGMRIESIEVKDESDKLLKRTTYEYVNENGGASGHLLSSPYYDYRLYSRGDTLLPCYEPLGEEPERYCWQATYTVKTSNSVLPLATSANGSPVGYDRVTIKQENEQGESLGKSVYYYKNSDEHPQLDSFYPNIPNYVSLDNGQLTKEEHYNEAGKIVSLKEYGYKKAAMKNIQGLKIYRYQHTQIENRDVKPYNIRSEWWYMDKEEATTYDINGNNPVTTVTTYDYANSDHKNVTKTAQTNSEGKTLTKKYYYPSDRPSKTAMNDQVFTSMITDHVLNPVLKEETILNDRLTQSIIRNHTIRPRNEDGQIVNMYLPENIQSLKNSTEDDYETRLDFKRYDGYGNILEVSKPEGVITSYIWGYNREYPIAKIENASYQDIAEALRISVARLQDYNENNLSQINTLRSRSPNAMVATYIYDPLIGVTSMTDPRGYTMTYHYDEFNRLKFVKDQEGNIVSENEYHYKNN